MALNYIWFLFFMIAFAIALVKFIITGDVLIFKTITEGIFKSAGDSVDLSFKLIGIMTLFLGFMKIGRMPVPFDCFPGLLPLSSAACFLKCRTGILLLVT